MLSVSLFLFLCHLHTSREQRQQWKLDRKQSSPNRALKFTILLPNQNWEYHFCLSLSLQVQGKNVLFSKVWRHHSVRQIAPLKGKQDGGRFRRQKWQLEGNGPINLRRKKGPWPIGLWSFMFSISSISIWKKKKFLCLGQGSNSGPLAPQSNTLTTEPSGPKQFGHFYFEIVSF